MLVLLAFAVPAPSFATCPERPRWCAKMLPAKARFAAAPRKRRSWGKCEPSVRARPPRAWATASRRPCIILSAGFFILMSSPPPIAGDFARQGLKSRNFRCGKISTFALAQKRDKIHWRIRSKVSRYDPIASTLPFAASRKADFANASRTANFITLSRIGSNRIDNHLMFVDANSRGRHVAEELRQFRYNVKRRWHISICIRHWRIRQLEEAALRSLEFRRVNKRAITRPRPAPPHVSPAHAPRPQARSRARC